MFVYTCIYIESSFHTRSSVYHCRMSAQFFSVTLQFSITVYMFHMYLTMSYKIASLALGYSGVGVHRALSTWENEPDNVTRNQRIAAFPTYPEMCLVAATQLAYRVMWLTKYYSHGCCWWLSAYLVPGHLQPSWWNVRPAPVRGVPT